MQVTPGPNLSLLLKPGKLCTRTGACGYIVVRRRRNAYYVYLDTGRGEVYLGPVARFPPAPFELKIRFDDGALVVDLDRVPRSAEDLLMLVRGLAEIKKFLPAVNELIAKVLTKYKLA